MEEVLKKPRQSERIPASLVKLIESAFKQLNGRSRKEEELVDIVRGDPDSYSPADLMHVTVGDARFVIKEDKWSEVVFLAHFSSFRRFFSKLFPLVSTTTERSWERSRGAARRYFTETWPSLGLKF
jgi:hypothetical protein